MGAAGHCDPYYEREEIARAMVSMARNKEMRLQMGETGYQRVLNKYQYAFMIDAYRGIYSDFARNMGLEWEEGVSDGGDRSKT